MVTRILCCLFIKQYGEFIGNLCVYENQQVEEIQTKTMPLRKLRLTNNSLVRASAMPRKCSRTNSNHMQQEVVMHMRFSDILFEMFAVPSVQLVLQLIKMKWRSTPTSLGPPTHTSENLVCHGPPLNDGLH